MEKITQQLTVLKASLAGDLFTDQMMRTLYATDASVYRELPLAVAMPKGEDDIRQLIHFARSSGTSLIPRTAGTSLAGQCVGSGIVVDCSKYMTKILEVNAEEGWVRLQPGVVRDDLNHYLKPHGRFFGPNTSTANRAMIGGMVGNNSCGSYSIVYGTTRDHVMELKVVLSDGSTAVFKTISLKEFETKCKLNNLEGQLYRHAKQILSNKANQEEIRKEFPRPDIHRRNTGYAIDVLLESAPFTKGKEDFNFCKLITGSEGTLAFITEIKIHVDPLPPKVLGLTCIHFNTLSESLRATIVAMQHQPRAVELMDKIIMDCTKENKLYQQNRFFVEGDPEAILIIEAGGDSKTEVDNQLSKIEEDMKANGFGYHYPRVYGSDIAKVWNLRKAGLGLLSNVKGDAKPVAVIEDTAVGVNDLPAYIEEITEMMDRFGQRSVYYAHAGAGEIHLRPILNLKKAEDVLQFHQIGEETAKLVKKYDGSLSGEHGDGRVRAEFIPLMIGEKNYQLIKELKATWDSQNIFNPGKIVDAPAMNEFLRYEKGQKDRHYETLFDFSEFGGILKAVEQCNGSADCRKSHLAGGTMCPSYMASRNEKDTTRARANVLREFLTRSEDPNPFSHKEIYEVMDLCLSCKGCTSECPSNVDMAALKAEFLHHYYEKHGVPFRARAIANIGKLNQLGAIMPAISNFFLTTKLAGSLMKKIMGVAPQRSLPAIYKITLKKWYQKHKQELKPENPKGKVFFFCDEFTNFNDTAIGIKALKLLSRLGYEVEMPDHAESGRAYISKGLLKKARSMAMYNVEAFRCKATDATPLIGLEPSAIFSFKDEYPRLVIPEFQESAKLLSKHVMMLDDFFAREIEKGNISTDDFTDVPKEVLLHGHCHQKALGSVNASGKILSLPSNYKVTTIPSGCCGMAGSFGYEKEHYELSMQVGELVLFPTVRKSGSSTIIAAPGTSCRHQIADGTGRLAQHPVEVLWDALK